MVTGSAVSLPSRSNNREAGVESFVLDDIHQLKDINCCFALDLGNDVAGLDAGPVGRKIFFDLNDDNTVPVGRILIDPDEEGSGR